MGTISLLIPILAGFWVYNDAKKRGHTTGMAVLWAAGTIGLLIVFLPLYLIMGRRPPMNSPQQPQQPRYDDEKTIDVESTVVEETIYCPMCANKVKEEFKLCPYCGSTLQPTCEGCGQPLRREWKTCPQCQQPTAAK